MLNNEICSWAWKFIHFITIQIATKWHHKQHVRHHGALLSLNLSRLLKHLGPPQSNYLRLMLNSDLCCWSSKSIHFLPFQLAPKRHHKQCAGHQIKPLSLHFQCFCDTSAASKQLLKRMLNNEICSWAWKLIHFVTIQIATKWHHKQHVRHHGALLSLYFQCFWDTWDRRKATTWD